MNIIIPIAGPDNGNSDTEYIKSLQEIERKTVIQYVFETLGSIRDADVIVVVKRSDAVRYHLDDIIRLLAPGANIVMAEGETMGAACTCLLTFRILSMISAKGILMAGLRCSEISTRAGAMSDWMRTTM